MGTVRTASPRRVLTSTHNLCFWQKYEKYGIFLSENLPFVVVKFSIYLNRLVFVMGSTAMKYFANLPFSLSGLYRLHRFYAIIYHCHLSSVLTVCGMCYVGSFLQLYLKIF